MMPVVRDLDLTTVVLQKGAHASPRAGMCVMEAAAFVAGREHTDSPPCVSPVIAQFCRSWNDAMNDEDRQVLRPYIVKVLDTNTGYADDITRSWLALDWLCRVYTPAWLRLAGLTKEAEAIEATARIGDAVTAGAAQPSIDAAQAVAWAAAGNAARAAAWAAAGDAAGDAAGAAAGDAARAALRPTVVALQQSALGLLDEMIAVGRAQRCAGDAAGAAARAVAGDAAGDAARDAAWDAARAAARAALRPTVVALQQSALGLLDEMIAVGRAQQ